MTETIITEEGEIKIEQQAPTPEPIKISLTHGLKTILSNMTTAESNLIEWQKQLDRICSQLITDHWETLAITQIRLIAERNADAATYLTSIGK